MSDETQDLSGEKFAGYRIERLITADQICSLYLAHDDVNRPVYLLVSTKDVKQVPDALHRYQLRVSAVAELHHANIVPVKHAGETPTGQLYAEIPFFESETLREKIEHLASGAVKVPVVEALQLIRQIAAALGAAHNAGIIHHDLRPENILVGHGNTPFLLHLELPENFSSSFDEPQSSEKHLNYLSPEEANGSAVDRHSNIYSFGVILYELLAGHRPEIRSSQWDIFHVEQAEGFANSVPLEEVRPGLSEQTYRLVRGCLWREVWNRFDTFDKLILAIDEAIAAEAASQATPPASGKRRWILAAAPVTLLLLVIGFFLLRNGTEQEGLVTVAAPPPALLTQSAPPATAIIAAREVITHTIELVSPAPGSEFTKEEPVGFEWSWPVSLEPNQRFAVYLLANNERKQIGTTETADGDHTYQFVLNDGVSDSAGIYSWQVILELVPSGRAVVESKLASLTLLADNPPLPSQTPSPSATATEQPPTSTVTNTPEPTCRPSRPNGWAVYLTNSGDTIARLASSRGTTIGRIIEVNCLSNSSLGVGQILWLPPLPPTNTPVATATIVPPSPTSTPLPPPPTQPPPPPPTSTSPPPTEPPPPTLTPISVSSP